MQQPPTKIIYKTLSFQIKDNLQGVICVYAYTLENQNIFAFFPFKPFLLSYVSFRNLENCLIMTLLLCLLSHPWAFPPLYMIIRFIGFITTKDLVDK